MGEISSGRIEYSKWCDKSHPTSPTALNWWGRHSCLSLVFSLFWILNRSAKDERQKDKGRQECLPHRFRAVGVLRTCQARAGSPWYADRPIAFGRASLCASRVRGQESARTEPR